MKIQEVQVFENRIYGNLGWYEEGGTIYLNLEQCARGLGFTTIAASGNEVIRWNRVSAYLKEMGVAASGNGNYRENCPAYIPENIFYRLAMKAKNETAERFQAWIADEVVPSIQEDGVIPFQAHDLGGAYPSECATAR